MHACMYEKYVYLYKGKKSRNAETLVRGKRR